MIEKLNGFSLLSLLMKVICPLFVPGLVVSSRTVKVSELPAAIVLESPPTRLNPVGKVSPEVVSAELPSLRTVKVRSTAAPPSVALPKLVKSVCWGGVTVRDVHPVAQNRDLGGLRILRKCAVLRYSPTRIEIDIPLPNNGIIRDKSKVIILCPSSCS